MGRKVPEFQRNVELKEAFALFLKEVRHGPLGVEILPMLQGVGRVAARSVKATADSPPFTRASADGYAIRTADLTAATTDSPLHLPILGRVEMGKMPKPFPKRPGAVHIPTGGMLPPGADAILMAEEVIADRGEIIVSRPLLPNARITFQGEEIKKGSEVLRKGTLLGPEQIGLLAEFGYTKVPVARRPRVAIYSTGDELVSLKAMLRPAHLRDSNSLAMAVKVQLAGGEPELRGILRDDFRLLQRKLREGLRRADMVLLTGGTAVGQRDFTCDVLHSLGRPGVLVNGISVRGGRPIVLAAVSGKPLIGLPGFPPGALSGFDLIARQTILWLAGAEDGLG